MTEPGEATGEGGGEGGAGAGPEDWRAGLSEELRAAPSLQKFNDLTALAQGFVEQEQFLGNAIRPPGPEASDEQRAAFFAKVQEHAGDRLIPRPDPEDPESLNAIAKAMGRPEEASGYVAPELENFNTETFDAARPVFHELGLTNAQVQGLAKWDYEVKSDEYKAATAQLQQEQAALQQEWGVTYAPRLEALTAWLKRDGAPDDIAEGVGSMRASEVKFLHSVMHRLGATEGDMTHQPGGADSGAIPPAEAQLRADDITTQLLAMEPGDPRYKPLVDKRMDYIKMANPGASTDLNALRSGFDPAQFPQG